MNSITRQTDNFQVLDDISSTGKHRPWKERKMENVKISESMLRIYRSGLKVIPQSTGDIKFSRFGRIADTMGTCSKKLTFKDVVDPESGELKKKLDEAWFCKKRLCPMCQWRRSLKMFYETSEIMDKVQEQAPELEPIFLTLTVQNCSGEDLDKTFKRLSRAWNCLSSPVSKTLHAQKFNKGVAGWFRTFELTYNTKRRNWHPHIHAILLVKPCYFHHSSDAYFTTKNWIDAWKNALKVDYAPSVDIRSVKGDKSYVVAEVSKYAVKPGKWLSGRPGDIDKRVALLQAVLNGKRLIAFGGIMKKVRAEIEAKKKRDKENGEDLVHVDGQGKIREDLAIAIEHYGWRAGCLNEYVLIDRQEKFPNAEKEASCESEV